VRSSRPFAGDGFIHPTHRSIIMAVIINGTALDDDGVHSPALLGTAQDDILNANWSAGGDVMFGGRGNDRYHVNSTDDQVIEAAGEGTDLVVSRLSSYTLSLNVENLTLDNTQGVLSTAVNGTGNTLDNTLVGNDRANVLRGLDGNDTLWGGSGNDTLYGGNGQDRLYGGSGNDTLYGDVGSDTLDGGIGDDRMAGGIGNDTYYVDSVNDVVIEGDLFGGVDRVVASVSETLDANVENLTLHPLAGAINGTGNALANAIGGNHSANTLSGLDGNDTLSGLGGNDRLLGGNGNDVLAGGYGVDTLGGGAGQDRFQFGERGVANADTITDFNPADDTIVLLNALDAGLGGAVSPGIQGLVFYGGNAAGNSLNAGWFFKGAGYDGNSGANLSGIFVDTNTGQFWYNPTSGTAGDSHYLGTVNANAVATLGASDFVYG
jgi:Ca2+-binding RTX toxin-like protein